MNKEQYKQRLSELSYALDNFDNLKKDSLYDCISLGAVGFEKLIKEHFDNHNNTDEFEHFKPFSDGTLKSMTKADLIDYIHVLLHNWEATDQSYNNVMEYAKKLQKELDNPPLKFEELEEGMWVWDNLWYEKNYVLIKRIFFEGTNRCVAMLQDEEGMARLFEENRFYRMEVK